MDTVVRHTTDCGLTLVRDGDVVYPLTRCCGAATTATAKGGYFDPITVCASCYRSVPEAQGLAAMIGHKHAKRDFRQMIESLTDCTTPAKCATALVAHYEQEMP